MALLITLTLTLGLLVTQSVMQPPDWQARINSYDAFYGLDDSAPIDTATGYPTGLYMPLLGNGYVSNNKGVTSNIMFMSGLYNGETTSPSHRANIPASFDVAIDEAVALGILLDVGYGTYYRRGQIGNSSSWYELRWYAHRNNKTLYIMELDVNVGDNEESATITLTSTHTFTSVDIDFETPVAISDTATLNCGNTTIPETSTTTTHRVCVASTNVPQSITIEKDQSGITMYFISAYTTNLMANAVPTIKSFIADDLVADAAISDYNNALASTSTLWSTHVDGWTDLWQSGVEITGRGDVAAAINASLYAILSSVTDEWVYGLAPGGLTNYYNGHSFWDTETWMYPSLLLLHPKISQSLLMYRYNRLDGARQKAASYAPPWSGTMFPWESAYSGVETCPTSSATGLREDHISGDIAFAIWQEWQVRHDIDWLSSVAYPILTGIADFWVSRSVYTTDSENITTAHINDVIPPDEYVDHVDDSPYTNFVASQALKYAVQAAYILNQTDTCTSCATYTTLANELIILEDEVNNIHPEYAGYEGALVKQADVILLHYPLGMLMNSTMQLSDLEYYVERTDSHGPAMTWGMFSIGFLDLQNYSNASKYFNMSFQDNLHQPLNVWTETPDGNAVNFITGAGGFMQTVIYGYPGIRIAPNELFVTPICVEGSTQMKIRGFNYLGYIMDFEYYCNDDDEAMVNVYPFKMTVTLKTDAIANLVLTYLSKVYGLETGQTVTINSDASTPATISLSFA